MHVVVLSNRGFGGARIYWVLRVVDGIVMFRAIVF